MSKKDYRRTIKKFQVPAYVRGEMGGYNSLQSQISRLKRRVSKPELKYHDVSISGAVTTTPTIDSLTLIAQGTTSMTREALQIKMHSMEFKWLCYSNNTHDDLHRLRYVIVQDRDNQGAQPAWTDVFESASLEALREKHQTRGRFTIWLDKVITLPCPVRSGKDVRRSGRYFKRFKKPIVINYVDSTASDASTTKNAFFLLILSDDASNGPALTGTFRIRFTG